MGTFCSPQFAIDLRTRVSSPVQIGLVANLVSFFMPGFPIDTLSRHRNCNELSPVGSKLAAHEEAVGKTVLRVCRTGSKNRRDLRDRDPERQMNTKRRQWSLRCRKNRWSENARKNRFRCGKGWMTTMFTAPNVTLCEGRSIERTITRNSAKSSYAKVRVAPDTDLDLTIARCNVPALVLAPEKPAASADRYVRSLGMQYRRGCISGRL